ncbi:MAG: ABC transporter substrate-binding protein [Candidatus ainarchaeum sp.]|nr:ABC transporter substrate-binding protein [Candidatus ainarchaeum sp.]
MKKLIWIVGLLLILVLVFVTYYSVQKNAITVGVIIPLSGSVADLGLQSKNGFDLAINEGIEFEFIFEDSVGDKTAAINAYNKLVSADNAKIIICQLGGVCDALADIAKDNDVILLGLTSNDDFAVKGKNIFNVRASGYGIGKRLAEYLIKENYNSVAVLYNEEPTHAAIFKGFKNYFEEKGGKVVYSGLHKSDEKEFKTELLKANNEKPEGFVLFSRYGNLINIIKQKEELGINLPIFSNTGVESKEFIDSLGPLANGIIFSSASFDYDLDSDKVKYFISLHEKMFGTDIIPFYTANAYEVVDLLNYLKSKGCNTTKEIISCLENFGGYESVLGKISFDSDGGVIRNYLIYQIQDGAFVKLE